MATVRRDLQSGSGSSDSSTGSAGAWEHFRTERELHILSYRAQRAVV